MCFDFVYKLFSATFLILSQIQRDIVIDVPRSHVMYALKLKQSRYRPAVAQRVPGS
jgi:hypothetical protein